MMGNMMMVLPLLCSLTVFAAEANNIRIDMDSKLTSVIHKQSAVDCSITVLNETVQYFRSLLDKRNPYAIFFHTDFGPRIIPNATRTTLRPGRWLWTYTNTDNHLPYMSWGNDYALLSFGLLNTRTLDNKIPVKLETSPNCPVTYGDPDTTTRIMQALKDMTTLYHNAYQHSYYCFMAEVTNVKQSIGYTAAIYFMYPQDFINFNCCYSSYNPINKTNKFKCYENQIPKWRQFTLGPYVIGLIIFLYFPIGMFHIAEWVSMNEIIKANQYAPLSPRTSSHEAEGEPDTHPLYETLVGNDTDTEGKEHWVYLDGNPPYTILDVFKTDRFEWGRNHPVLFSRLRRLVFILLMPCFVYLHVGVYYLSHMQELIDELIDHQAPLGFLSLVGTRVNRADSFAPWCGGPLALLVAHQILSAMFIVLPKSFKQIVENGMPHYSGRLSPLFLNVSQILHFSKLNTKNETGYRKGAQLCICGIHMVFSDRFWKMVIAIQTERFQECLLPNNMHLRKLFIVIFLPWYLSFCFIEMLLCVIVYGVPFFTFVSILVRGLSNQLTDIQLHMFNIRNESSAVLSCLVFNPVSISLLTVCLFVSFAYCAYASCLIFVEGFVFIAEVFVFTFAAVLLFPGIAFGSVFFFTALLYYFVSLVSGFGNKYLELLAMAVEVSQSLSQQTPKVEVFNNQMIISNVTTDVENIVINDILVPVPEEELKLACTENMITRKIRMRGDTYGIPRKLFNYLIRKYMPPNKHILHILFKFLFVCGLTGLSLSYMKSYLTGPATGISKVMHMVFVLIVGAGTPRFFEMALTDWTATSVEREAKLRRLKRVIEKFYEENYIN